MVVVLAGNAHEDMGGVVAELNTFGVLEHHDTGLTDGIFDRSFAMGNGNAFAHIGTDIGFAFEHAFDVTFVHKTSLDQSLAGSGDGFFLAHAFKAELDIRKVQNVFFAGTGLPGSHYAVHLVFGKAGDNLLKHIILREVAHEDMFSLRGIFHSTLCQFFMGDDNLRILGDIADGGVGYGDMRVTCIAQFLAQAGGTEGAGAHAGITGINDGRKFAAADAYSTYSDLTALFAFLHSCFCFFEGFAAFFRGGNFNEYRCYGTGNHRGYEEVCHVRDKSTFRRHGEHGDNGTRRGRGDKTAA